MMDDSRLVMGHRRRATGTGRGAASLLLIFLMATPVFAFPPAPHHTIYGQIRDELGNPVMLSTAEVYLETSAGVRVKTTILPEIESGANYRLIVPMDAGLTADVYKPTALSPVVPFKLWVRIGTATYLPIEMTGNYRNLGKPGERTRIDLTLGQDSDGDGLPDAWELMLIAMLGGDLTLADIRPEDDLTGRGMSNHAHYIAGTYAWDPEDGFKLKIAGLNGRAPILEFTSIRGRNYTVLGSSNLTDWVEVEFKPNLSGASVLRSYLARDTQLLRVEVPAPSDEANSELKFFKLGVK